MKKLLEWVLYYFFRIILSVRYKFTVKGLDKLNDKTLTRPGGVLFLPNHPTVFSDPLLASLAVWKRFPIRPMVIEYMYYMTGVNWIMRFVNALPVPNFNTSSNSLKRKRSEKVTQAVIDGLRHKENFLIYPSGRVKDGPLEIIGGASAVHRILQEVPEANVVLVRIKGLWGSSFSRALTGKPVQMGPKIWENVKIALKNLIFFIPRRYVEIELVPAPADFPYNASRLEINRWLEQWYNQPDGLSPPKSDYPGDSLILVPYYFWSKELPKIEVKPAETITSVAFHKIPIDIREKITQKISQITEIPVDKIRPDTQLTSELGLDSLDLAELGAYLHEQFDVEGVHVQDLTTPQRVMEIAAHHIVCQAEEEDEIESDLSKWHRLPAGGKKRVDVALGETIPEVFLNNCARMGDAIACSDSRTGILTYSKMKLRVVLLADMIKKLPGNYIGILLPSSATANLLILAIQLAGKVPIIINWTIGPRHLEAVVQLSNVETILTSWTFLDRLHNVDLEPIEDRLTMLEDLRHKIGLVDKAKAFIRSKYSTRHLLKLFGSDKKSAEDQAVLLFTSGTESMPKGVPLTHRNILSNQRSALQTWEIFNDDVFLSILPPFHAFGFTVTGLLPLLSGIKVAYFPDATNGKGMAKAMEKWDISLFCGTPTFIKGMLQASTPQQIKFLRLCVTGAEKAPQILFDLMASKGKPGCLVEGYGITECSPVLTINRIGKEQKGVGEPLPGVELTVVNPETFEPLPKGSQGLVLARGDNIFKGYLNPGLSKPFVNLDGHTWYNTGDLGYLDEENRLILGGRKKRFVKIGGEMVSLSAIEEILLQQQQKKHGIIEEGVTLAVCARELPGEKTRLFAFTKLPMQLEEANEALRLAGFSNLVKISTIIQVEEIPLMGTGKTNYRDLDEQVKRYETKRLTEA